MVHLLLLLFISGVLCRPSDEAPPAPPAPETPKGNSSNETDTMMSSDMGSRNASARYSFYNHGVDNDTLAKMNSEEIAAFTEVFKLWANDTLNAQQKMEFLEKELNISDEATATAVMNTLNITLCFADYIHEQKRKLDPKLQEVVNKILSKMTDFTFITQDSEVIDSFINETTKGLSDQLMKQLEDFDEMAESEMKKLGIELDLDDSDSDNGTKVKTPVDEKMAMSVKKDDGEAVKEDSNSTAAESLLGSDDGKNNTEIEPKNPKPEDKDDKDGGEKHEKDSVETHKDNNSEELVKAETGKKADAKMKRAVMEEELNSTSTKYPNYDDEESKEGPEPTGTEEKRKRHVINDNHHGEHQGEHHENHHHNKTTPKP